MDWPEAIRTFFPILQWIAAIVFIGATIYFRSAFVPKKDHNELVDRMVDVEKILARVPTDQHVNKLSLDIEKLHGEIKTLNKTIEGMEGQSVRVERFLEMLMQNELEKSKK